jgi:predicted HTH domain antitoxin
MTTVTKVLEGLKDVRLKNISPGNVEIELFEGNQVSVTKAIKQAGYSIDNIQNL